jgi:CRP/FNR family transcriptional regulator, cyclic AMP receptor protein
MWPVPPIAPPPKGMRRIDDSSLESGPRSMTALTAKAVLQRNYLFRGLPEEALERVASLSTRRSYDKGAVIFSQGDPPDALYGVASGRVRISASGAAGQEVFLNIMEPGDTFGEIAVMDGLPRTAGATALDRATLIVVSRRDFLRLLEREPRLAIHLLKLLCERLRWTSELVEESAFLTGPARLAKRLLILATLHGRALEIGRLELRISQAELARFLGISRQIVNQHLSDWRRHQWVDLGRSRIVIRNAEALRQVIAATRD